MEFQSDIKGEELGDQVPENYNKCYKTTSQFNSCLNIDVNGMPSLNVSIHEPEETEKNVKPQQKILQVF